MTEMRIQKYMAYAGIASRRKAEQLIKECRVTVNGKIVNEPGTKVSENDIVEVDGKPVSIKKQYIYIALNKPVGYICSAKDQFGRKTVLDLVNEINERIYPVGRLDYDTSGLIFLTNDGEFTYMMTHPKHEIPKTYIAEVKGSIDKQALTRLKQGVDIGGFITSEAEAELLSKNKGNSIVKIIIHEGKYRQVRRMFEAVGFPVLKLKRIKIGNVELGELETGAWRYLAEKEIDCLKMFFYKTRA